MEEEEFFRLLTPQSLVQIDERIAEEKAFKKAEKQAHEEGEEEELAAHEEEEPKPNPKYEAGKKLPLSMKDLFPVEYTSKPLEDFDEFYETQKVRLNTKYSREKNLILLKWTMIFNIEYWNSILSYIIKEI